MIIDLSLWSPYEGASEGSGRSEKIWLQNNESGLVGLFKFTKSPSTTEHVSEMLAADLACLVGIPCAKVDIGEYNGRIGSMSYQINTKDEILIEGIYLINRLYPNYNPNTLFDSANQEYYSLKMVYDATNTFNIWDDLVKIFIFDFLIGNTDRHQSNWAVLLNGALRICPIYDNGSSLCCYIEENRLESYFSNDMIRFNALVDTKSRSRLRINGKIKKEPTQKEVLLYLFTHFQQITRHFCDIVNEKVNKDSIRYIIERYSDSIISSIRKELIYRYILRKVEIMNEVVFGKEE